MSLRKFQEDLEKLAENVDKEWGELNYKHDFFPELAARALKEFSTDHVPDLDVCLNEMAELTLPPQNFPHGEFSDFSLTLVRKEHFLLDIYFWYRADTNIHNHHFCGAFKVIAGKSMQIRYNFDVIDQIGPGLAEIKMIQDGMDILDLNAVHPIDPLDKFIHNVFHVGKPTITLCLRTPSYPHEALDIFLYPKYKLKASVPTQPIHKWLQVAKLSLAQGKVLEKVPFSDVDVVRMLYRNFIRQTHLDSALLNLLQKHLEEKKVAIDFQNVLADQTKFYAKLKVLSGT